MKISGIRIENIRNHLLTNIDLNFGLNIFYGLNGSGKTSILEAVSICGFSKSFLPVLDSSLINSGNNDYSVIAKAVSDNDIPYSISVAYEKANSCNRKRKKISSSIGDNLLAKDVIGEIPMVILSPDYKSITFGSPEHRRNFIDRLLSQSSKVYFNDLMNFRKVLKQRNSLLNDFASGKRFDPLQLKPWTEQLVKTGTDIMHRRLSFLGEFKLLFEEYYKKVSSGKEEVNLEYFSNGFEGHEFQTVATENEKILIENKLSILYQNHLENEKRRGVTLFGPQKDDIRISINGGIAKEFASQGQHKSLLVALKLAEFEFLLSKRHETPIVLLDDIFSELDEERIKMVFELINRNSAQTLITITNPDSMKKILNEDSKSSFFEVVDGKVFKK